MKIILMLLLCLLVIFLSYKFFVYYKSRQYFFQNIYDFCGYLQSEISFLKTDIKTLLNKKNDSYGSNFNKVLMSYEKALKDIDNFRNNFRNELDKVAILKDDEKEQLCDFFEILGTSNSFDQLAQIGDFKSKFSSILGFSKQENQKYGSMSVKLGILFAVAIFIIFI